MAQDETNLFGSIEVSADGLTCPSANSFSSLSCCRTESPARASGQKSDAFLICSQATIQNLLEIFAHLMGEPPCPQSLRFVFPSAFALECKLDSAAELCPSPTSPQPTAASWPWRSLHAARQSAKGGKDFPHLRQKKD